MVDIYTMIRHPSNAVVFIPLPNFQEHKVVLNWITNYLTPSKRFIQHTFMLLHTILRERGSSEFDRQAPHMDKKWKAGEEEQHCLILQEKPTTQSNVSVSVLRTGSLHIKACNMCICLTSMTAGRPSLAPGYPEYNILLLKWLPNQRTIYSIVYKLDFQFVVIMATYICCVASWKEIYIVCALIKWTWACMCSQEFSSIKFW